MAVRGNYNHTLYASYAAIVSHAVINNYAPLLLLTFRRQFGLSLEEITLVTALNFGVQLAVDLLSAWAVDRIGYRRLIVASQVLCALGLISLAALSGLVPHAFAGILFSVVLYAVGGGLCEVMITPIVAACPTPKKEAALSLLHSFYCWGHLGVILLSTLFFSLFGVERWRHLALLWALLPLANAFYFSAVPLYPVAAGRAPMPPGRMLRHRVFWVLMLVMVCAGASEQAMSQWASAFAESALGVSKTVGDLAGPCVFALLMGTARALHGRFSDRLALRPLMILCSILCMACYLLSALASSPVLGLAGCGLCGFSVGIFWPGTFSIAAGRLPGAGTAMYALMALAGDVGCAGGPALVGLAAGAAGGRLQEGLLAALVFPALLLAGIFALKQRARREG